MIHGTVSIDGSPEIPKGSCLITTLLKKPKIYRRSKVQVVKAITITDLADSKSIKYSFEIPAVSEYDMHPITYLTAVLNMGYCSKDGATRAEIGDYMEKRKNVYFEKDWFDYEYDLELTKVE